MVRSTGYLQTREDFENVPVTTGGVPVLLGEVARVRRGPTLRRGIAALDGEGEVVGGVIVLRASKNALAAIEAVAARLAALLVSLPAGAGVGTGIGRGSRRASGGASRYGAGASVALKNTQGGLT